jgi:hypothetical protein
VRGRRGLGKEKTGPGANGSPGPAAPASTPPHKPGGGVPTGRS